MKETTYTVIFSKDEVGGYVVTVPALRGVVSYGHTLEEAKKMAKEAIEGFLEMLMQAGQPIPLESENSTISDSLAVSIPA
ncbi:MAG TPA: type II toxin-antitoxin system HicB family antitoxin [Bacteroidetes bacterium]|nr:type II toxin-antitoxin system HicB family antitoxin [Bacteroidota bacterium]HEX04465.1 type II toxin-antitoxin system HicB family antitoxin [Bacteroidota bacterium]